MDRISLKSQGKAAFQANYWRCVLAGICMAIASGAGSLLSFRYNVNINGGGTNAVSNVQYNLNSLDQQTLALVLGVVGAVAIGAAAVGLALSIFVYGPLEVGVDSFFKRNLYEKMDAGELGSGFSRDYLHNVATMLRTGVFIFLWCLLLIIPGIIKSFSYMLVPYILSDRPELSAKETMRESMHMMEGHKWEAFVLGLSFLGWHLLGALTLGILEIFYVRPYECSTMAAFYEQLKAMDAPALERGEGRY